MSRRSRVAAWRGSVRASFFLNAEHLASRPLGATDAECADVVSSATLGQATRLEGLRASCARPDIVNVQMLNPGGNQHLRDSAVAFVDCAARVLYGEPPLRTRLGNATGKTEAATVQAVGSRFIAPQTLKPGDFAGFQANVVMPGGSAGSYSRHANHLWAIGSPVLLYTRGEREATAWRAQVRRWRRRHEGAAAHDDTFVPAFPEDAARNNWSAPLFEEWYYPALTPGETHVEVDSSSLVDVAESLVGQAGDESMHRLIKLGKAAREVHDELMCPCCLVEFYAQLIEALADAQGLDEAELRRRMDAMPKQRNRHRRSRDRRPRGVRGRRPARDRRKEPPRPAPSAPHPGGSRSAGTRPARSWPRRALYGGGVIVVSAALLSVVLLTNRGVLARSGRGTPGRDALVGLALQPARA